MKENVRHIILILFMVCSLAPDIISYNGNSLKLMYIVFGILLFIVIMGRKVVLPPKKLMFFFFIMILISLIASIKWGVDRLFFNYCFGFVIICIILSIAKDRNEILDEKIFRTVWIILVGLVVINDIKQGSKFIEYVALHLEHPYIDTVVTGGVNLEATWIGILAISFFNSKKRWWPFVISCCISLIYASRVGIIANVIACFIFIFGKKDMDSKRKILNRRVILTIFMSVILVFLLKKGFQQSLLILIRFKEIGFDNGSVGRLSMWKFVIPTLMEYPFGVGLGNSIKSIETISHLKYMEDNLHNLYMQMFVELGVIGGGMYLWLWGNYLKKEIKNILTSPIVSMLFIYFILAFLQFKGGETIFFCILGVYLTKNKKELISK